MARSKEYDREDVLNRAVMVFWQKGFEGTSMGELVKATGLNTFSMYREFGSKEGLFEAALERYYQSVQVQATRPLTEDPGLGAIKNFLNGLGGFVAAKGYTGCLIMNTIGEKETVGRGAMVRVEEACFELVDLFERSIRAAQKRGEIARGKDAKALANYLLCFAQGLTLYGRTTTDKRMLEKMVAAAIAAVEG